MRNLRNTLIISVFMPRHEAAITTFAIAGATTRRGQRGERSPQRGHIQF